LQQDRHLSDCLGKINKQISLLNKTCDAIKLMEHLLPGPTESDATEIGAIIGLRSQFNSTLQKIRADKDNIFKNMEQYNSSKEKENLQKMQEKLTELNKNTLAIKSQISQISDEIAYEIVISDAIDTITQYINDYSTCMTSMTSDGKANAEVQGSIDKGN
jgi:hypothetical protein